MTKNDALTVALNLINDALDATNEDDLTEYVQELEDAKQKISEMRVVTNREEERKVARQNARKEKLSYITPVLRDVLSHTQIGMNVADITADFTAKHTGMLLTQNQIQYILLHDMKDEVEVIKNGRNANTYRLRDA